MTEKQKKWSTELVAKLTVLVGADRPVSANAVEAAATALEISARSVAAKLRQLDIEVDSLAKSKTPRFTQEQGESLAAFINSNANQYTYKEISAHFQGGEFSPKEVQGKVLALELTGLVKPAEKIENARTYSEAEEATFIKMANAGSFIEEIASALGREVASVRGKALSLTRSAQIEKIPAQRESHSNAKPDPVEVLGDKIATMTVAEIAVAVDKTERGVKTLLTRRGINVADYKGEQKKAKAESKTTA